MASSVELLLGPPGTGKTTELITRIRGELAQGVPSERIGLVSFSRRALTEARERVSQTSTLAFPMFRTIHATAFNLLGLSRDDVMQTEQLLEFGEAIGIAVTPTHRGESLGDGTLADQALALYGRAKAREVPLREEWMASAGPELSWDTCRYVGENYDRWKALMGYRDFSDMIAEATGVLPVDVLYIDEAQDTSAAQWSLLRAITPPHARVVIAGDDDQCVYGWAGASADFLFRVQGHVTVLAQSHRLPRQVKTLADRVIHRVQARLPKVFAPRDAEGAVEWVGEPESVDLTDGRTHLLLARSHRQLMRWQDIARQQGVVYSLPSGAWSWSLPAVQAAFTWEKFRKGDLVPRAELVKLNLFLDHKLTPTLDQHQWSDFFAAEGPRPPWYQALIHMPDDDREYIRLLRARGVSFKTEGKVRISTIHAAKGAEAQHVALFTDLTDRIMEGAIRDPDAEWRVLYVAVTRASETLTLVQPSSRYAYAV